MIICMYLYTCHLFKYVCTPVDHMLVTCLSHVILAGSQKDILSSEDVHTVASLLKLYLRELPEPTIPYTLFDDAAYAVRGVLPSSPPPYPPLSTLLPLNSLSCSSYLVSENNQEEGIEKVLKILQLLPSYNYNLLKYTW